jgi:putative toxin-antitoxin system antitoxin component (TIGR02293 family)
MAYNAAFRSTIIRHLFHIFGEIVAMVKTAKKQTRLLKSTKTTIQKVGRVPPRQGSNATSKSKSIMLLTDDVNITHWLALSLAVDKSGLSDFDFIKIAHHGITKGSIDSLASYLGITKKNLVENIFDVSVKTLERKDTNAKLDKKTSSHAVEIAKVIQHAYEVFRDPEKIKLWVNRENKALNNNRPVQLFDTLTGLNMVNDILGRIEEGVYS